MISTTPPAEAPPAWWTGAPGKVFQRTVEGAGKVLMRPRDDTVGRRAKVFMGQPNMTGYTVEADVRGREQRRQRGDVGLINERYGLVLFGNGQKLELHPWQAADEMTVRVPFTWDADKWYRMKLRVDQLPDGTRARARQGVAVGRCPSPRRGRSRRSTRSRTRWAAPASTPTASPTSISIT